MRKKKYVVRVVIPTVENSPPLAQRVDGAFLECLRYAGIVTVHRDNEEGQVFDIHSPFGAGDKAWSEMNAQRMQSFGYNAVSAFGADKPE